MFLLRSCLVLALLAGLTACQTTSSDAPSSVASADSPESSTSENKVLVHCERPLGTTTIVEPDANATAMLQNVGLQSPTPVLRIMVSQSNCFRVIDRAAAGGQAVAQYAITPNILFSNSDAGGINPVGLIAGVASIIPGGAILSAASGSIHTKEVQTALFISNGRTGEQIAAVQGIAHATDFNISFAGLGGAASSVSAYGNTPEGKVVMAAYLDAYDKLVAEMQQSRSVQTSRTH
jgi:hypothetical protein